MFSFVPKLELEHLSSLDGIKFTRYMHRTRTQLDFNNCSMRGVYEAASNALRDHLSNHTRYYGGPRQEFVIHGFWIRQPMTGSVSGLMIPIIDRDVVCSDAFAITTGAAPFAIPVDRMDASTHDSTRFAWLPKDISITMLRHLDMAARQALLNASPSVQRSWSAEVSMELPTDEVFVEISLHRAAVTSAV